MNFNSNKMSQRYPLHRSTKLGPTINLLTCLKGVFGLVLPTDADLDRFHFLPEKHKLCGVFGNIVFAQFQKEECAIKLVHIDDNNTSLEEWEREVLVSKLMSDHEIGPRVFTAGICKETNTYGKLTRLGYLVMTRFDHTLKETDELKISKEFVASLRKQGMDKLKKMYELGWSHGDIHQGNIMVKLSPQPMLFFIDFGKSSSVLSSDSYSYPYDINTFNSTMKFANMDETDDDE